MASQKISQFTAITTLASGDYFPVIQASGTSNKRVDVGVLDVRYTSAASGVTAQNTANQALASGNAALASGNAALASAATAQASGNAALSALGNKYDKVGGPISGPVIVQSQAIGTSTYIQASGVITLNFGAGNNFEIVLTSGTQTLASPINASGGQTGTIIVRQDNTGTRLLTYSGSWAFQSNTAPTLTTTASGVDIFAYYVANSSRVNAVATLNYGSGTVG
jgi:hypothetical protein